ncbi:M56 family metallopeptidase [Maribacter aestuarii]|uniref:M56 family metallopeptidase n=1 Tax=Maribacter aestuarii TaxID=1130723 RepID=UPI0025A5FAD0|nr:M56 family metallopeptidase [Maribacter aestuarii]
MTQYILECIAFQLVFLIIYDFFLKRETFFQWNRVYLIGSYALSLILPWIKIEAFKTEAPTIFNGYAEFLWNLDQSAMLLEGESAKAFNFSWQETLIILGATLATIWFGVKIWRLVKLRKEGSVHYFKNFTRILVPESSIAFSFFKSIFLGEKVPEREYDSIISHELVHIRQWHSLDLLFFELMRIVNWFNPLVYVYQNRIAELHEFIADAQVPKTEREAHYELLLSQAFQTQNISFVNQFFKTSLIKKRIVMLKKSKSKKVWQLKYVVLVPLILGMLAFTSSKKGVFPINKIQKMKVVPFGEVEKVPIFPGCENDDDKRGCFFESMREHIRKNFNYPKEAQENGIQGRVGILLTINTKGAITDTKYRGPDSLLTNEAKRIIAKLPVMQPGYHEGNVVSVAFSIPITFKLDNNSDDLTEEKAATRYSQLLIERARLVQLSNESNKVIVNLDKQLKALKESMDLKEESDKKIVRSKNYDEASDVPFSVVDEIPIFPGCENTEDKKTCFNNMMQSHISKNFNYPKDAEKNGIEGQVNLLFKISDNGIVKDIRYKGADQILNEEAERIIKKLPKMIPGKQKGKEVNVIYSIPITFKLD